MNLVSSVTGEDFLKQKKTIRATGSGGGGYAVRNNFSCQRLEDLIGDDLSLEGADVSGELLCDRLIGPDFQDVLSGVAGSGGVEGVT